MSKSPGRPTTSTTSWTIPKPANVLSYAYLWRHEAAEGQEEGRKNRPVVVVVARRSIGDRTEVMVVPVTTQAPRDPKDGFEIPASVKRALGLDAERCWVLVTELNHFIWPGPDVRPIGRGDEATPYYGFLPERLFRPVLEAVKARAGVGRLGVTKRTE